MLLDFVKSLHTINHKISIEIAEIQNIQMLIKYEITWLHSDRFMFFKLEEIHVYIMFCNIVDHQSNKQAWILFT